MHWRILFIMRCFLAGGEPDGFDAPVEIAAELYRARAIESYDVACLRAKFRSGITLTARADACDGSHASLSDGSAGQPGMGAWSPRTGPFSKAVFPTRSRVRKRSSNWSPKRTVNSWLSPWVKSLVPRPHCSIRAAMFSPRTACCCRRGGISTIEEKYVRRYTHNDEGGYDVAGLYESVKESFQRGKLFSELGFPWAVKTAPVPIEDLKTLAFPS